jgi:hypothetical protein
MSKCFVEPFQSRVASVEWTRWSSQGMRAVEDEREATWTDEAKGRRPSNTHGAGRSRSALCTACPGRVDSLSAFS